MPKAPIEMPLFRRGTTDICKFNHTVEIHPVTQFLSPIGFDVVCTCGWSIRVTTQSEASARKQEHHRENS